MLITPIIGYVASRNGGRFKKWLLFFLIIQSLALCYEYVGGRYIYSNYVIGVDGSVADEIDETKYADVGFRPKGLLFGTLDATSLIISSCVIFFKSKSVLFLMLITAIMSNGRLAILLAVITLLASFLKVDRFTFKGVFLSVVGLVVAPVVVYLLLKIVLSEQGFLNLMQAFDLESNSNRGRLLYMALGIQEFADYSNINKFFGNGGYFNALYGSSAESGMINLLLNIGIYGFAMYVVPVLIVFFKSIQKVSVEKILACVVVIISLSVFRFEAGYLRGGMYWFILFYVMGFGQWHGLKKNIGLRGA